jgi:hypothetical protein
VVGKAMVVVKAIDLPRLRRGKGRCSILGSGRSDVELFLLVATRR